MAKIVEPSGKATMVAIEDREQLVPMMLNKWKEYCERNWLNDSGDVFSPESKVKTFLDSIAYYLLLGNMDGIETMYRSVMNAKREIPVSSCPSSVDNIFYASGGAGDNCAVVEKAAFKEMCDRLDEKASLHVRKPTRKRTKSLFEKKRKLGIHDGEWFRVDTNGEFWIGNEHYAVAEQEIQYQAIKTAYGDYYAMDKILYANGSFYDMNYDKVDVFRIGGIVSYDVLCTT